MGFTIGETAAYGSADTRRRLGIDDVEIEADVEEAGSGRVGNRLAHARLDAHAVDVGHREHLRVDLLQQLPLALVERAHTEEREAPCVDCRDRPALAPELVSGEAESRSEHHPV